MAEPDADRAMLQQFLADRDVPCPQCGYNLRTLSGAICPECGEQLALGVHLVEPKQAAPIAGLIGLSAGFGLNGLLLIYAMIRFRDLGRGFMNSFIIINAVGFVVLGCCLLLWLKSWRWIRRREAPMRWSLAAVCWALSLIDLIVFSIWIK
jgi:hypothetical protein